MQFFKSVFSSGQYGNILAASIQGGKLLLFPFVLFFPNWLVSHCINNEGKQHEQKQFICLKYALGGHLLNNPTEVWSLLA